MTAPPDPAGPPSGRFAPVKPPRHSRGADVWAMTRKFLKKGTTVASIAPSSRYLVREMLAGIDFGRTRTLVELGAGLGPITAEIVRRSAGTSCRLLIVEYEPDFCKKLRERFAGTPAEIIQGDACEFDRMLEERGIDKAEQVVSGLPVPSFSRPMQERLFTALRRRLDPAGEFRQLTVMPWVYKRFYRRRFESVRFKLVARNIPPGGVYLCRGVKK
jgi:phospholipid N-methyltransferase